MILMRKMMCAMGMFLVLAMVCGQAESAKRKVLKFQKLNYTTQKVARRSSNTLGGGGAITVNSGGGNEWGIIQGIYESKAQWSDGVEVKTWVLLKKGADNSILQDKVTYNDVPGGKGNTASFFIHPNVLMRYGRVSAIHMEIWLNGEKVDEQGWPRKQDIKKWTSYPTVKNGLYNNRMMTPFAVNTNYQDAPLAK